MLEMAINNVEMGSELDRVHILTCCDTYVSCYGAASKWSVLQQTVRVKI